MEALMWDRESKSKFILPNEWKHRLSISEVSDLPCRAQKRSRTRSCEKPIKQWTVAVAVVLNNNTKGTMKVWRMPREMTGNDVFGASPAQPCYWLLFRTFSVSMCLSTLNLLTIILWPSPLFLFFPPFLCAPCSQCHSGPTDSFVLAYSG